MATQINVAGLKREIEQQKNQCLYGPVHVFADSSLLSSVNATSNRYSSICQNPNLFSTHSFSASTPPEKTVRDIAECLPRVLIVAIANFEERGIEMWIRQEFPSYLQKVPYSNIRFINTRGIMKAEREYLESFGVIQNPTVLVFKMGHLIDSFVPPVTSSPISSNPSLNQQLKEYNEAKRKEFSSMTPPNEPILLKHEKDKLEWEEKERLKKIKEARKEQDEKTKERLRVKAMIEQQRRNRQNQNH